MPRLPRSRRRAKGLLVTALFVAASFLLPFLSVAAQVTLSAPAVLPGNDGRPAASGRQEEPQVSKGSDTYLAVWTDARSTLSDNGTVGLNTGLDTPGNGNMLDIYAARLNAAGQVIDTTPFIVTQAPNNQGNPRVGWNGQNWLVTWLTTRPRDEFSHTQDLVAARVSPAGQLLDPVPVVIKSDVSAEQRPGNVIEDGAGNWVVVWETFLPQEGTSIPRGAVIARVAGDGTVLDPGGRVVYNHHSQFMGNVDIARAGDRYLLTFMTYGPPYTVQGVLLDSAFNNLRNGPEQFAGNGLNPRVASNGETWFVVWADGAGGNVQHVNGTRVSREGNPLDVPSSITVNPNIGTSATAPQVAWDGSNWFVTYETGYNPATQTYLTDKDVYLTRVSPAGAVTGGHTAVAGNAETEVAPAITPGVSGGAVVAWHGTIVRDVYAARVSAAGVLTNSAAVGLGAPRQSKQRIASSGTGFLVVFRSDQSNQQRVYAQRLDQNGAAIDAEPFLLSDQTDVDNPSVAWNGSAYLVVWDAPGTTAARQTFSRVVPTSGLPPTQTTPPTLVMNGYQPDVAGLDGTFLVTNILPETPQIRTVQSVRVDGTGTPLGTPVKIERLFDAWPRAVAFGGRWLVIWEGHNNHDDSPGTIRASFVAPDGTASAPFVAADLGNDLKPEIAVAGDKALVVWTTSGNVYARRLNADGTSPEPAGGAPVADAAGRQAAPSVAWDGSQYVVTWLDQRRELFPQQPDGDVYAARVAPTNVKLEEFAVAGSELPEETPFVVASNGLTLFSYAKFYDGSDQGLPDHKAHRVTLRTSRLPAPEGGAVPAAPLNLVAEQVNSGPGTGTVNLRWVDAGTDETGFKVEYASTAAFTQIRLLGANATTAGGISVGTAQNRFRVRAYNSAGDSDYSNVATPPVASMTSPNGSGAAVTVGRNFRISVSATDPEGVALVEFYSSRDHLNGSTADPPVLIGVATAPGSDGQYNFEWIPTAGYYHLTARVTDITGSSTTTYQSTLFVRQPPSVAITSPTAGAVFKQPAAVTLTATARTNNGRSDEYVERIDFYDGARWIGRGTNAEWQAPWSFVWQGATPGTHTVTAHATSSWGETVVSLPVVVVVTPEQEPEPDLNIKPVVLLTSPLPLANFAAGATVTASATATDEDGTVERVEFRANGRTVEIDTAEPFAASLNLPGGTHDITAVAFDNRGGSTAALPARINVERTAGTQLTSTQWDGQSNFGPSVLTQRGAPVDQEMADDFDLVGDIDRVVVNGSRGFSAAVNPSVRGAYVRFYAWQNGSPGALQDEQYLAAGDPALVFDPATVSTVDVRLPHSFRASGKHFVSVQLVVEGYNSYWYWYSSRSGSPQNSPVRVRDNYAASPAWASHTQLNGAINADAVMQLYGTATTPATLAAVAPQTAERSGWFTLTGTNFGASQGASRVLVDKLNAIVVQWSPTEVVAYVPEGASLGEVDVVISNPTGTSNALKLNVTGRKSVGRIRWQTKYLGDYMTFRPAVAPSGAPEAGSVYAEVGGLIYAWSPTGELRWVKRGGGAGHISVGTDGTVYVGDYDQPVPGTPYKVALMALNPKDGGVKWRVIDTSNEIFAGPNVGPDGKVYVAFKPGGFNTAAFNPDGTLAWSRNNGLPNSKSGSAREFAFGPTLQRLYFNSGSPTFAYDLAGTHLWTVNNGIGDKPAIPPDGNLRIRNSSLSGVTGANVYNFPVFGQGAGYPAAAGPDNVHYVLQNFYRLFAVNPDGSEKWHFDAPGSYVSGPNVSPSNSFVLMGGGGAGMQSGFFVAIDPATGQQAWRQTLPTEPGFGSYGDIAPFQYFAFNDDGATAYTAGDILGDGDSRYQLTRYGYFYALNTTKDNVAINQPPVPTLVSPLPNSNVASGTTVEVAATVEDDGPVDRVEFFHNHNGTTTKLATVTEPDSAGVYRTQFVADTFGVYGVFAVAIDDGGLRGDSAIAGVFVNVAYPVVRFVSPTAGQQLVAPASITLKATATDRDGTITLVEFYSNGKLGETTSADADGNYTFVWNNPPREGQVGLTAWGTDNQGNRSSSSITINIVATATPTPTPTPAATPTPTPVGQPPVVNIDAPADGTTVAPGTAVNVTAAASDPDGTITRVDFYRVYSPSFEDLIVTDFNAPYTTTIGSSSPTPFDVVAVATDNSGNRRRSAVVRVFFQYPETDPQGQLSISGRIRHQTSAPGNEVFIPHALVKLNLNNSFVKATQTDAEGRYSFGNLSYGGRYEIIPSEPGYQFFPPSVFYEGLFRNETLDFVAAGPVPPGATPTPTPAPGSGALKWERFYDGPQHLADYDPRVTVDAQGNTYVAATSGAAGGGDTDISLVKYSPAGAQLWAASYVGEGNYKDWASDVKTDAAGNVYVAGTSWAAAFPGSEYDIVVLKYNAAGQRQWARVYNGPVGHWDIAYALAIDSAGNVVVAGSSQGSTTEKLFDEFVTVKYDPAGNQLWARRHSTQQIGDEAYSLVVDASNNVYVGGTGYAQTGGVTSRDIITVKYDPSGAKQWASRFTGVPGGPGPAPLPNNPVSNEAGGIGLDPSGNVYVFGANNTGTSQTDYLLLKYNPATGALVWSRNWSGESNDYPRDMVIDQSGNVYLTGESWDGDYQQATSENTWDAATVKFDGAGTFLWARIYRGFPGKVDGGRELALDQSGNVYAGGYSEGFVNGDTVVIKYKPDGTEQWVYRYDNPEHTNDSLRDMTSDASGNLYLAGQAVLTNASGQETADLVTVKLAASTAELNASPDVSVIVGPTIAGAPETFESGEADSDSDPVNGPNGPTIAGRSIVLSADASDADGTVASVSFYDNGVLLGTTTSAPYTYQWDNAALGTHAVSATATDNNGATRTSATVTVTFNDPQPTPTPTPAATPTPTPTPVSTPTPVPSPTPTPAAVRSPFGGSAAAVPGQLKAENFDSGAEGVAYHDTTPQNEGGAYRQTGVDIYRCTDGGCDNIVGWIKAGEWLDYTVQAAAGSYAFEARVSSGAAGGRFRVEVDGVDVTGPLQIPNTGGTFVWQMVSKSGINLTAGQHVVRVVVESVASDGWAGNFDYFRFTPAAQEEQAAAAVRLQAEDFDSGAEGVAYHDTTPQNEGGAYRQTGVDIYRCTDGGCDNIVGWIKAGEWLKYSTDIAAAGTYTLGARVSSVAAGGTFHVEVDGVDVTGPLQIPNTGGTFTWALATKDGVALTAGRHALKVVMDSDAANGWVGNFDWLELTPAGQAQAALVSFEAEDFDEGGEGVAYHDATPANEGGAYRQTGVDVYRCTDGGCGHLVGWVKSGEWLRYTVEVATAGAYTFEARASNGAAGGRFHVEVDGADVTGPLQMPNTGGTFVWQTVSKSGINLTAGRHVVRVVVEAEAAGGWAGNFDWFKFSTAAATTNQTAPVRVQAEDFDSGAEGVAYHDTTPQNEGGAYRQTGVDIYRCTDGGCDNIVGWIKAGEWLKYSTDIAAAGTYTLGARVSSVAAGGTFHVEVDGVDVTGPLQIPNTGGTFVWQTVSKSGVNLAAGRRVVRLVMDSDAANGWVGNFDSITFTRQP